MPNLKIFNIPEHKTQSELENEFGQIASFKRFIFMSKTPTTNSAYGILELEHDEDLDLFVSKYIKLRTDIVVYREQQ